MRAQLAMAEALAFELANLRRWREVEDLLERRRQKLLERVGGFPEHSPHQRELEALRARLEGLAPLGTASALRTLEAPLEQAAERLRRRPC